MKHAFLLLIFLASAVGQVPSVHDLAGRVDRYYNTLQSFEADFTESYTGPGILRSESGTLQLKQPGRMRWDYKTPTAKLFLTDGKNAWFYVPGEQQARRTAIKQLDDLRSPLRYLLGHAKLEKELNGLSLAPDVTPTTAGNAVLRGIPKGLEDRVREVLLEISPASGRIDRIVIHEIDGSTTEFRFGKMLLNTAIPDARFRFTPPAGVQVIDAKDFVAQ